MEKELDITRSSAHNISIKERQSISITGIVKINSFDSESFFLETVLGNLNLKGRDLEIVKLDTYEGTILIKGIINAFEYLDEMRAKKENSMFSKLFK